MTRPTVGSLFSGFGGLDMAVCDVLGADVAWHCQYEPPDKKGREDRNQYAARVLAERWPGVPNLGDVTRVTWADVPPVRIVAGGSPCQDLSLAGRGAGMADGTRSGLWASMAEAVAVLRPDLVFLENVGGLLSAKADRGMAPRDADVEAAGDHALRALGRVLGDLAGLGFDARWCRVRASDVGAPHQRARVFVLAWPSDAQGEGQQGARVRGRTTERGADTADAPHIGRERVGPARKRGTGPTDGDLAPAHTHGRGFARHQERHGRTANGQPERQLLGMDADGHDVQRPIGLGRTDISAAHAQGDGRQQGRPEPAWQQGGLDAPERGGAGDPGDGAGRVDWGPYAAAIERWETTLGRPAPGPVDDLGRLAPAFVEWMMGLPEGHVTDIPGIPRGAQLKALGNGVVPQQAAHALRLLLHDAAAYTARAA